MEDYNNIDFNFCKVFLAVANSGSISKAAEMLYVSQPAVSYSIKQIEEKLNCKLFNRTTKGVELTADAEKLKHYIESAYNTLQLGFKALNDSNDLLNGEVRIGVPTHICLFLVSEIIAMFNEKYPGIKFKISNRPTSEMVDMLEKRELDIIIDSYPIETSREDVTYIDLLEVENCFAASNKYSNLIKDKKLNISKLNKYPLLLQQGKTSTRKALEEAINGVCKFEPNIEVATTEVMLDLVKKGLGIGYFTEMSIADMLQTGELIKIDIAEELPKTKICMVYINEFLTNAAKKFTQAVREKANTINNLRKKTLRIVLLQDCIYNCTFCHKEGISNIREDLIDNKDIAYLYKTINRKYGINKVHLTGGEPLLRKDLKNILQSLKNENAYIKMTTNGYLLDENMWIGEYVDKLNISMHSFEKDKYEKISNVEDSYEKVVNAIRDLRFKYPTLKICINMTLLKHVNDDINSISTMVKFASSIKADIKIIEIYPNNLKEYTDIKKAEEIIKKLGFKKINSSFRKNMYFNGNQNVYLQKCTCNKVAESSNKEITCRSENDIYLSQDGNLNLCRNSEKTINIYDYIKEKNDELITKKIKEYYDELGKECKC